MALGRVPLASDPGPARMLRPPALAGKYATARMAGRSVVPDSRLRRRARALS